MSAGTEEMIHRAYEVWNQGDPDALAELFAEDCVYVSSGVFPGLDETYKGPDGMRRFQRELLAGWEHFAMHAVEIEAAGQVSLIHVRFEGRGRASGIEVGRDFHHLVRFAGAKIEFLAAGDSREQAVEKAREHGEAVR